MTVPYPVTKTKISTTDWGIPITDAVNTVIASTTPSAWTAVTFQNGWSNFGSGLQQCHYRGVGDEVEIRGVIGGGTTGTVAFTLPTGFRPPATLAFPAAAAGNFATANITAAGTVAITAANTGSVHLSIRFSTIA